MAHGDTFYRFGRPWIDGKNLSNPIRVKDCDILDGPGWPVRPLGVGYPAAKCRSCLYVIRMSFGTQLLLDG